MNLGVLESLAATVCPQLVSSRPKSEVITLVPLRSSNKTPEPSPETEEDCVEEEEMQAENETAEVGCPGQ